MVAQVDITVDLNAPVQLAHRVQKVMLANEDCQDTLVQRENQEQPATVHPELRDQREIVEHQVLQVKMETKVCLERLDLPESEDTEDKPVLLVQLELGDTMEHPV